MSQQLRDVDIKILEPDNNAINDYYIPPTYKRQTDMLVITIQFSPKSLMISNITTSTIVLLYIFDCLVQWPSVTG